MFFKMSFENVSVRHLLKVQRQCVPCGWSSSSNNCTSNSSYCSNSNSTCCSVGTSEVNHSLLNLFCSCMCNHAFKLALPVQA